MKKRYMRIVTFCLVLSCAQFVAFLFIFRSFLVNDWSVTFETQDFVMTVSLLIALLVGGSLLISAIVLLRKKLTEAAIEKQLQLLIRGRYLELKADEKENWISPLFEIQLDDFYRETSNIAKQQEKLAQSMQEMSSQPQYVGSETRETIIEMERHRIARELHDSVSQQLFAAMMMLSAMSEQKGNLTPIMQQQLSMIEKVINDSQSEMRALLLHLRPISLENKTLKEGIESLLRELATKVQIHLQWDLDDVSLLSGIEDHLFRITQELLSNALRHAKAKNLEVYLKQNGTHVTLRMIDDGIGFDTHVKKAGSYGLSNIKERVQAMGGTLKIISFPNQGTIIDVKIPRTPVKEKVYD